MDDRQVKLLDDVAHLDDIGEKRAFDLLAVSHLKSGPTADVPVVALVTKLFAVVGLLPALRKLLLVTAPSPVVTPSQLEIISDHIRSCHALLCKIDAVVCETDKLLGRTAALDPQSAFGRQEQHNALTLLTTCFHDIAVIVSAARASHLERFGYLYASPNFSDP
jgi:hypothetical protein